jgi:hypothetical protein
MHSTSNTHSRPTGPQVNWQALGFACHRADFHTDEDQPKKLWVMELARNARALLSSPAELPTSYLPHNSPPLHARPSNRPPRYAVRLA